MDETQGLSETSKEVANKVCTTKRPCDECTDGVPMTIPPEKMLEVEGDREHSSPVKKINPLNLVVDWNEEARSAANPLADLHEPKEKKKKKIESANTKKQGTEEVNIKKSSMHKQQQKHSAERLYGGKLAKSEIKEIPEIPKMKGGQKRYRAPDIIRDAYSDGTSDAQERPRKKQKKEPMPKNKEKEKKQKTPPRRSTPGPSRTTNKKKTTRTLRLEEEEEEDVTPPRALITQWLQIQPTTNWALICKNYPNIEGTLKARLLEGGSVFNRGRKPNRILRCCWKYCVHNDPVALEDAIALTTPIPRIRTKKKKADIESDSSEEIDVAGQMKMDTGADSDDEEETRKPTVQSSSDSSESE